MSAAGFSFQRNPEMPLGEKLWQINRGMVLVVLLIAVFGFAMLYSAAGGSVDPWAARQAARFGAGLVLMLCLALIDVRFWFRYAYLGYLGALGLLLAVEIAGSVGMGAQRWIDLKVIQLQRPPRESACAPARAGGTSPREAGRQERMGRTRRRAARRSAPPPAVGRNRAPSPVVR